jgi:hypothetical protein
MSAAVDDRERDFAKFIQTWCEANLGSFGDRTDQRKSSEVSQTPFSTPIHS